MTARIRRSLTRTATGRLEYLGYMPVPKRTDHLRFREMTPSDLDNMAALLGDSDVMSFYSSPKSRDEALKWIEWNQRNYAEHGFGLWVIETLDSSFIGDCGLTLQQVNGTSVLEVGYHVRTDMQGKGWATEAATACRDFAREHIGATELVAIIHPDNKASERVAQKIGMTRTADDHSGNIAIRTVLSMRL